MDEVGFFNLENFNKKTIIVIVIVGLFLIFLGIYLYRMHTKGVYATIIRADCVNTDKTYKCRLVLNYVIDGKKYSNRLDTTSKFYRKGDIIQIYYDTNNPNNISINPKKTQEILGKVVIFFGILANIFGLTTLFSSYKDKIYETTKKFKDAYELF